MGIVAGMPVGTPIINKDQSLTSVGGRVKCIYEVVNAGLVLRILACYIIHQDLCPSHFIIPSKPKIGVAVKVLLCCIQVLVVPSCLVQPKGTPCKLIFVTAPGTGKQMRLFCYIINSISYCTYL